MRLQIDCSKEKPDLALLRGPAVFLTFPKQPWIDLVATVPSITALFIDRPKTKELGAIANLPLTNLTMSYPSGVKDWSFLLRLPSLVRLSLHNTLSLPDLSPVEALPALEVLELNGGYSKVLRLPSLAPVAHCRRLVAVLLAAVRFSDWSVRPLFDLPALRRFDCPLDWPADQIRALTEHNRALRCNVTDPG